MSTLKFYFLFITFFLLCYCNAFSQKKYTDNDTRWNRVNTAIYPVGNYVQLPQKLIPLPKTAPKVIRTPHEVLVVNPNIMVLPSPSTSQTEVPLVASKVNPNFMFGSSNAVTGSSINSGSYITTDGGVTWFGSNVINNSNTTNQRGDPGPLIDKNQRVIFTHLSSASNFGSVTGMAAEYSTDFGQTFSASVQVHLNGNDDKELAGTDDNPSSPFYGNSYMAFCDYTNGNTFIARTTDGGVTWQTPVVHPAPAGLIAQGHDVDTRPNGDVIVCWTLHASLTENYVGVGRSTDGGVTFTYLDTAYQVNGTRSNSFNGWGIRTNGFPRISIDKSGGPRNGWIYIVTDEANLSPAGSDPDVIMHRSTDGGLTWSAGIRVNQDSLNNGKVQWFPCIHVDSAGGVNVAYYDNRNFASSGDSCSVFISRSLDGGNTWTDIEVADHHFLPKPATGFGNYLGDYIGITSGNGKVWAFWMDDKTGTAGFYQAWAGYISINNQVPVHDIACGPFLSLPSSFVVNQPYSIKTKVTNAGTSNETNIPVKFFINGVLTNTSLLNLNAGQSDSISNPWTPAVAGTYVLTYCSALSTDTNRSNDTVRTTVVVNASVPELCEGFLSSQFPPQDWSVAYTGTDYWSRNDVSGFCISSGSAMFDNYFAPTGTQQQLITKTLTTPTGTQDSLVFQDAYATYQTEDDQLEIKTSTDAGTTWTSLIVLDGGASGPLVTAPPTTNVFTPTCTQWKYQSLLLPPYVNKIQFNAISAFGNELYIDSICLHRGIGVKRNEPSLPRVYSLSQNYPNPFNPSTKIQYALPKAGVVKLVVYDILGAEITTLVNEYKHAGIYEITFNGNNLASGVYFYRITSGDFVAVKKMLLVK